MWVIEGWWSIPYCALILVGWTMYNMYWCYEEGLIFVGILGGILWFVTTIIGGFRFGEPDGLIDFKILFYLEFIPLFLLCFFGTISGIKYLIKKDMLNYDYIIFAVPVLLTLTLFFI